MRGEFTQSVVRGNCLRTVWNGCLGQRFVPIRTAQARNKRCLLEHVKGSLILVLRQILWCTVNGECKITDLPNPQIRPLTGGVVLRSSRFQGYRISNFDQRHQTNYCGIYWVLQCWCCFSTINLVLCT